MAVFVLGVIFGLVGLAIAAIGRKAATTRDGKGASLIGGGIVWFIGLLLFIFSCLTIIGTHDIGVLTTFGRPSGSLSNGLHLKWPWQAVTKLDGRIQTDTYASNGYNGSDQVGAQDGCVNVRIARQATACVNLTIRWQLTRGGVDYLFKNYKTNDNIRDNLLHRDLQTAVNVAFARYDPLALDASGDSTQPTTAQLAGTVKSALVGQVGQWLNVSTVFIPIFNFDPATQSRLNGLQQQVAQTRIAQQAEQTAAAQAAANKALAASVSHDPNVLVSKCLDILNEVVQKGGSLPAGFSCFPGSQSGVAVAAR
jgi:regulator of protease activity HflC (stomatin/prohibitin superfamily)